METQPVPPQPDQTDPATIEHLPESHHKHHKWLIVIIGTLLLFAIIASFVAAFFYSQNKKFVDQSSTPTTTQPEPTSTTTEPTPDPTADWQTYSDPDFSFRYPLEWTMNESGKNGNLFNKQFQLIDPSNGNQTGIGSITIIAYDNPNQLSLEDYEAKEVERYGKEAQRMVFHRTSGDNVNLGNSSALLLTNEDCEPGKCDVYLLSIKKNIYRILVRHDFVDEATINQILSTFQFTDHNSVIGIDLNKCCPCPSKVSTTQIGQNGWVEYEPGKDYSQEIKAVCTDVMCKPCQLIEDTTSPASQCQSAGGTWLTEHNECENISQASCQTFGGTYTECGSACRHIPDAQECIQVCVQVCAL